MSKTIDGFIDAETTFYEDGAETVPSISFLNDPNTGLYRIGNDNIGISCNGVNRLNISTSSCTFANPILIPSGNAAAPGLAFSGDPDLGIRRKGGASNTIDIIHNGIEIMENSATATTFKGSRQILQDAMTAAAPAFSFSGDPDTGIYRVSTDTLGFACGGTQQARISTTAALFTQPVQFPNGTASLPSVTSSADPNTGISWTGSDGLAFSTGGTQRFSMGTSSMIGTLPLRQADGLVSSPSFSFSNSTSTGMYSPSSNIVAVSSNGVEKMRVNTTHNVNTNPVCFQNVEVLNATDSGITIASSTSIANIQTGSPLTGNFSVSLPSSPAEGQILYIANNTAFNTDIGINAGQKSIYLYFGASWRNFITV